MCVSMCWQIFALKSEKKGNGEAKKRKSNDNNNDDRSSSSVRAIMPKIVVRR